MNKKLFFLLFAFLAIPAVTFAHQTQVYEINGTEYRMVIGSLNEPVIVDDKTGVFMEIEREGQPFAGAQEVLQVEMIAGDKSEVVNLSPIHGADGQYSSPFIATVPTTLTYRLFGTLENTPIDLSFTCNPAGHPQAEEDLSRKEITAGVVQTLKRGAYGCPQPKEAFGFPEAAPNAHEMNTAIAQLQETIPEEGEQKSATVLAVAALILAIGANGLAYFAYRKKSN